MYVQQVNKHTLAKGKGNVTTYCLIHSALRSGLPWKFEVNATMQKRKKKKTQQTITITTNQPNNFVRMVKPWVNETRRIQDTCHRSNERLTQP